VLERPHLALPGPEWKIVGMRRSRAVDWSVAGGLALVFLAGGCSRSEETDDLAVSEETYVEVMTQLMLLDAESEPGLTAEEKEARADSLRGEILAAHGVTAGEILDFARATGPEAGRMEALWEQITQNFDSTRIANLRTGTEARSESRGKLGSEARAGADRSDTGQGVGGPASRSVLPDSLRARNLLERARKAPSERPPGSRTPVRDTTPPRG